jgi:hypothetical protein
MIWPNPNSRLNNDSIESSWLLARWHNGWSKLKQALGLRTQKESREFSGGNKEQKDPEQQNPNQNLDQKSVLEWTCHVCGELRPDDKIGVYSRVSTRFGVELTENVRYCNDKPDCFEKAKAVTFLPEADEDRVNS